jgi:hypothetical protein
MPYEHDIFLSYPHRFEPWTLECFLPELEQYLSEELDPPTANIFVDRTGIRTGDAWLKRLKKEVTQSRCVVAIWSPQYFHSEWCRLESSIMLYRETELGYRTIANPQGLVFPVRACDGDHFPQYARDMHWFDCAYYVRKPEVFKNSQRYITFQDQIIAWVPELAAAIKAAPAWRDEWLTDEWLDRASVFRPDEPAIEFSAPLLH